MPSVRVSLAISDEQWVPTEGGGARFTAEGRDAWVARVQEHIAATMGVDRVPQNFVEVLRSLEPSPTHVERYIFVPLLPGHLAIVMVVCSDITPTWRDDIIEAASHPVGLVRDTEIEALDVPYSDEGILAVRCEEKDGHLLGSIMCAVPLEGQLVMVRGTSRDMLTIVALRQALIGALSGAVMVPAE